MRTRIKIQISGRSTTLATLGVALVTCAGLVQAQEGYTPEFTAEGELVRPDGNVWREWPYVGSLVTPNALNDGEAPFPEHHIIYIDPDYLHRSGELGALQGNR